MEATIKVGSKEIKLPVAEKDIPFIINELKELSKQLRKDADDLLSLIPMVQRGCSHPGRTSNTDPRDGEVYYSKCKHCGL